MASSAFSQDEAILQRPNILIIFADDLGYETVGAYGALDFSTPNLDAMAEDGMRFLRAYTSPVCTPSRVSLHTGLYTVDHKHTGVLPVHTGTREIVDFTPMPTFAQLLRENGYQTSVTGKWQLATLAYHPKHPYTAGFDSWCLWQIWDGDKNLKTTRFWNPCLNRDGLILNGTILEEATELPNGVVLEAGTTITDARSEFGPDVLNGYVQERMAKASAEKQPFLILHNMMLPHRPIIETPAGGEASLAGMVSYMDMLVGSLLKEIEQLGIRENTYVFFIGDNGTESGNPRQTIAGAVMGGKRNLNDAGTHVPFIVWGPEAIPEGTVNNTLVDITDIFPTVCALADVPVPETLFIRGHSIAPQILGDAVESPRTLVHMGISGGGHALYDGHWRYVKKGKSEVIIDSSALPIERVSIPETEEATLAKKRLRYELETIIATSPR
ncbi:sulfatase-like hydrolase/transferase [Rubellicoccus peritrichatus]|uniref:Sulfatase-like hydrolase/transferase n=1 Tax=Rubellicoccus peritrichatus TaxID=3080537 RepID=A0AAQ3LA01_9BACT|nr:sulfatase-like hydrolase/transferase [Puniceicoccus sp. CR14]WOO40090.1 sulfatase-like hydrolase/transferase [Puniceicoccus sp. CR14]